MKIKNRSAISAILCFIFTAMITVPHGTAAGKNKWNNQSDNKHEPYNAIAKNGIVAAAHPTAAEAGLNILKKGGNAVDAAIATAFSLNVVEPFASGIGGGGFMVLYLAQEKKITTINFREKAPIKASPDMYIQDGETNQELRTNHGLAVAVPGALAGWDYALKKYGTMSLNEVIQPAIETAETGYMVSQTFSQINKDEYEKILLTAGENSCYLNHGFPYEQGDTFKNPELAATFRIIAKQGIKEFYHGDLAQKIVAMVTAKGGVLDLNDLKAYATMEQQPLKGTYRDYILYTVRPPASGGLHIIQLLNILKKWPLEKWGHNSPEYIHHFTEALRFIFADRERYLGDPAFVDVPVDLLISEEYGANIAAGIDPNRIKGEYPFTEIKEEIHKKENTTHLCVVDRDGNIVSMTQSINHFFGSGIVPQGCGFILNNHMDDFSSRTDSVNAPRPEHRPVSSMGPLILFKESSPILVLGSPGGTRIFSSLTQIIVNVVDFNMDLDEAIEAPRFFSYSIRGKERPVSVESRIPAAVLSALEKLGNKIQIRKDYDTYFGGAQGIMFLEKQRLLQGGADSRRDGYAAGY
ncbi:MAG: gamma-glutamyltransferase [Candidatus Aminicenantes bacterium]|nr:gamma-glutamyltransferase [Candidatus Aminicenantes bacterium]